MLKLTVRTEEWWNDATQKFVGDDVVIELEHSLFALSKWESEFEKPFLSEDEKSDDEAKAYIRCMIVTPEEIPPGLLDHLNDDHFEKINAYLNSKQTASWVSEPTKKAGPSREKITSELIFYWMTSYQIPWEAQYWHIERLFMLIKIFNAKQEKPEKRTAAQRAAEMRKLNEDRLRKFGTSG